MNGLLHDFRYAVRQLRKTPGLTATAIVTLALGIGANTAIFTLLNAVLLRPLPYDHASRLVWITDYLPRLKDSVVGTPDFVQWRNQNHSFTELAAYDEGEFDFTGGPRPERIHFAGVTASFLPMLGVQPIAGRVFRPEENIPGATATVILSYPFWQRRFGGDRAVVGTRVIVDGTPREIAGIMPASFVFPSNTGDPDVLVPLSLPEHLDMSSRAIQIVNVVGRLRHGVSVVQANNELSTIQHQFVASSYPTGFKNMVSGFQMRLTPLQTHLAGDVHQALVVLFAAVTLLLFIACANTANLQLTRASARRKEFGVRNALGASPKRLARQLLVESVLQSLIGGLAGTLIVLWSVAGITRLHVHALPNFAHIAIDKSVLSFAVAAATLSGLLSGLLPAGLQRHANVYEVLKDSSRTLTEPNAIRRARSFLVVAEIGLSAILLVGSALLVRSFRELIQVDPGFNPHNVLTFQISLPEAKYASAQGQRIFFETLFDRLRAIPGVAEAGAVSNLPLTSYNASGGVQVEGEPVPPKGMRPSSPIASVTTDYFRTMEIPLLRGRYFNGTDSPRTMGVVIVNQAFSKQFFPSENPIGKRVQLGASKSWFTIVGIVRDIRHLGLRSPASPQVFTSFEQGPSGDAFQNPSAQMAVVLRCVVSPITLISAVRDVVATLDREQPIFDVETMERRLGDSIAEERADMTLLTGFGLIAMLLAVVGIYGVISFHVSQRTYEIGVRMALGAEKIQILQLVLRAGTILLIPGIAIGLGAAFVLTRFLSSMLFGIGANDLTSFIGAALVLASSAFLACYIPARRAAKVDPMVALRYE